MAHPFLVGLHAVLGEIAILAFVWIFIEILNPTQERLRRAKIGAALGLIFLILSWFVGGFYYVSFYGANVKPVIKEGPQPWAHNVVMEAKEHIFLFLPFLAAANYFILRSATVKDIRKIKTVRKLAVLIILLGFLMALMGYLISTGFRTALEVMHLA
ncbi:MAG: hypothetical protein AABW64_01185 [Nanoarchaeota archaeon]